LRATILLCLAIPALALAQPKGPPPPGAQKPPPLKGEELNKAIYALGVQLAKRTPAAQAGLSEAEIAQLTKGISDALLGKPLLVTEEEAEGRAQQLIAERREVMASKALSKGKEYLAKAATEKGAQKTASGLIYFETKAGTGTSPTPSDKVKVHYRGTLIDGTEFDSSYKRGEPIEFPLNGVIKCWTEGVGKMKPGGKAKLVCPPDIAYGDRSPPPIPPNSVLLFEVELLAVSK
jgi:FKBP-type peptidyl-prolyl cis-trans isomerase FkpA